MDYRKPFRRFCQASGIHIRKYLLVNYLKADGKVWDTLTGFPPRSSSEVSAGSLVPWVIPGVSPGLGAILRCGRQGRDNREVKEGRRRLTLAALDYLPLLKNPAVKIRFDIVEVILDQGAIREVRHLPNAFPMEGRHRYG
jgi:hypothetical protein